MDLATKLLRSQLFAVNKIADVITVKQSRYFQERLGNLMTHEAHGEVTSEPIISDRFEAQMVIPKQLDSDGVILYLHGGGYVSGMIKYAKGFGTILAVQNHIKVCCVAYRLAPENKFPAALDDAYEAYMHLLASGLDPNKIILCGESAGGGLVYCLAIKLKMEGVALPSAIIAVSPWSDLTLSGESYETNFKNDPSITKKRLKFYAESYTDDIKNPLVSPLFADLEGLPPSLIFVGGDEIMLSDSERLHQKLCESGCESELIIAPEMWHIYLLYGVKDSKKDMEKITSFVAEVLK